MPKTNGSFVRGQICYVDKDETAPVGSETWADRYALIVSNDVNNRYSGTVEVVYLTTSPRKTASLPTHVIVKSNGKKAIAMCEQTFTVDKVRITGFTNRITDEEQCQIDKAILISFGINAQTSAKSLFAKWENFIIKYGLQPSFITSASPIDNTALQSVVAALQKERDGYKMMYESACIQLKSIKQTVMSI